MLAFAALHGLWLRCVLAAFISLVLDLIAGWKQESPVLWCPVLHFAFPASVLIIHGGFVVRSGIIRAFSLQPSCCFIWTLFGFDLQGGTILGGE